MKYAGSQFTTGAKFIGAILNLTVESMERAGFPKRKDDVLTPDVTVQQNRDLFDKDQINASLKAIMKDVAEGTMKSDRDIVVVSKDGLRAIVPICIYTPYGESANQSYLYEKTGTKDEEVWSLCGSIVTSGENRSGYPMIDGSFNKDGTIDLVFDLGGNRSERIVFEKGNRGDYVEKSRASTRVHSFVKKADAVDDQAAEVKVPTVNLENIKDIVSSFSKATKEMIREKDKHAEAAVSEEILSKADQILKASDQAKKD